MIQVTCANCGLRILVPPTVQGRAGICFGCGADLVVPMEHATPSEARLTFDKGVRIADRYIIDSRLGEGGMGTVYRAHDELVEEEVALKFMHPRMLRTQKGQKLFIKEAQVCRRLRHENIVAVHDVSTTVDGILYLSMEYIEGVSLREFLRRHRIERKLIKVRLAIQILSKMLSALEYAHRMVIHRDLKPENVMLLPGERVKVLDFGLAVAIEEEQGDAPQDKKRIVGTRAYASPEQHRHQAVDLRADLFTMGLVFNELLTLRTPVDEQVAVLDVRQDVSPSIVAVLNKSMEKDKERRYQSASAFLTDLKRAYQESYRPISVTHYTNASGAPVSTDNMVYLEGGSFLMGSNEVREEAPQFETHVEPFYMDKYPVTVGDYAQFIEATGHREPKFWHHPEFNGPRQPVTGVTLEDAQAYALWAGKRLPTEAEWEFAARGRENRKYPWGNLEPDTTRCNFGDYLGMPSIVTMHDQGASPEGVFDLAGNVFEWTLDGFAQYKPAQDEEPAGGTAPRRVARGGSWHSPVQELRTSFRKGLFPETQLTTVGFRCVLAAGSDDSA